ncbi:threonine-phosphate decarboxylase CobD [Paraglaciecola sp. 20A4]|uniref:threonine-phosphate decarboxylase CobD n=1 Tax=Paraglaciecola sp. 20A4 TaxID=2687288 RepID=UPI001F0F1381|nr:threonine-phosphate decarboxylase CobD [Paraglaciecola sp. 20A4]
MSEHTLVHGGQLTEIALRYNIPLEKWLDLSTGIAPTSYPVGLIPAMCWQRLPQHSDALLKAAQDYYQTPNLLATAGSQSIIQALPQLCISQCFADARVWLPAVGYQEHRKAWQNAHYQTLDYQDTPDIRLIKQGDIVLVINPNNPSGKLHTRQQLTELLLTISAKKGLLIIDEAFMDATPEHTMTPLLACNRDSSDNNINQDALIILRSVGKFFGLAGIRLGFVVAHDYWLKPIADVLGPWSVSGPAQYVGRQALTDRCWQQEQTTVLNRLSSALEGVLVQVFTRPIHGTTLFKTVITAQAPAIFEALCKQGIYIRLCDEKNALRFGIPNEQGLKQLESVLLSQPIQRLL